MHSNFSWDCPSCKNINWEHTADEYKGYKCGECKKEYQLSFEVEVVDIEEVEEAPQTNLIEVRISKDRGKTWYSDEIDSRDLNPNTSQVKPGDWLEVNGNVWEVSVNENNTRLHTKKLGVLSLIK